MEQVRQAIREDRLGDFRENSLNSMALINRMLKLLIHNLKGGTKDESRYDEYRYDRCDVCDFLFLINSPATKTSKAVAQMQSELKR